MTKVFIYWDILSLFDKRKEFNYSIHHMDTGTVSTLTLHIYKYRRSWKCSINRTSILFQGLPKYFSIFNLISNNFIQYIKLTRYPAFRSLYSISRRYFLSDCISRDVKVKRHFPMSRNNLSGYLNVDVEIRAAKSSKFEYNGTIHFQLR